MDSNSDILTQKKITSLALIENGIINLNGFEISKVSVTVNINVIPKRKKNRDTKICAKTIEATKSCRCTKNCISSTNNHSASQFKIILAATLLNLIFVLFMAFCSFLLIKFFSFSLTSKYAIFKFTLFCGSFFMLLYVLLLSIYFFALYEVLKYLHPSLTSSKCFSTLSKIIPNIFVLVIALLIFMLICSSFYINITTFTIENIFSIGVRVIMAFFSLFCFFCSLATYFYFLNKFVAKFPLTMDYIEKIFNLEI